MNPGSVVLLCSGVMAFITSVAWMNIQANEVVALLQTFGIVFGVNIGELQLITTITIVFQTCTVRSYEAFLLLQLCWVLLYWPLATLLVTG